MTYFGFSTNSPVARRVARRDVHRLFEQAFPGSVFSPMPPAALGADAQTDWQPSTEARETASEFTFELDLPGVSPESVEVLAADGVLTVRGTRPAQETADGERVLMSARATGAFQRRFRLPKSADLQKVSASYALGVLTVRVQKAEPTQPLRVPVSVQTSQS